MRDIPCVGLALILLLCVPAIIWADEPDEGWGVSLSAGWNTYVGDLNPDAEGRSSNFTLSFHRLIEDRTRLQLNLHNGSISGEYRPGVNINLEQPVEITSYFVAEVNSADLTIMRNVIQGSWLAVYGGIGLGIIDYSIEDQQGRNLRQRPQSRLEGEDYNTIIPYAPISLGFTFFASSSVNLFYERSWNYTNTDYLDNIGLIGDAQSDWIFRRSIGMRYQW